MGKDFEEAFIVSDFLEKGAQTALLGTVLGKLIVRRPDEILDERLLRQEEY
jgi:hypothetical protein